MFVEMKSETNLVCDPCVIYLASEKLHSYDYFTRWKLTHGLFGDPLRLGGTGPGPIG